ncbi:MAG: branched-chain amino acid transaminase [Chloroflexota bacterium]|nr:branched-chain amino acid transaminase [Chloroflexota bacterium]
MNFKSDYIWMDGELVPYEQATVHVLTAALHYGLSVFEGIRAYETRQGAAVFRLHEHLKRFLNSAHIFGIRDFPYSIDDLHQAVCDTIRANKYKSCYIRPLIFMEGSMALNLDGTTPRVSISTWEWGAYLGEDGLTKGVHMTVSSFTRHHINVTMTKAKIGGNYVNSVLAKTMAVRSGYDEAIMLDPAGYVAECTGENLFLVRNDIIYTPPQATILEGITRDAVITLLSDLGYRVIQEPISRDQLYIADEVFACGTAAEVTPVRMIDHRQIGDGHRGPVTDALQENFFETVKGEGKRSEEWLDYVE